MTADPPLKLKTEIPDELEQVQLERYVKVGGNDVCHRARVPVMTDEVDPELALRVHDEFRNVQANTRLHLNNGALKFEYYRQCLRRQARCHWDAVLLDDTLTGVLQVYWYIYILIISIYSHNLSS